MKSKALSIIYILLILLSFNAYSQSSCHELLKAGKAEAALASAQQALSANAQQIDLWQCQARAHGVLGQYQEGLNALTQAKKLAKTPYEHMATHIFTGNLHRSNQAYDLAIQHYQTSLEIAKAENNRQFTRIVYNLLGDAYLANQNANQALQYYQSGSDLSLNDNERAESYANVALAYQRLNKMDQAIEFQRKSVVMQQKAGTLDEYAEASLLLGQYFDQNKEYAHAEKTYQKLLQFSKDNGGEYYEAKTNVYLAQNKIAQADKAAAQPYLEQAKRLSSKLNVPELAKLIIDTEKNAQ